MKRNWILLRGLTRESGHWGPFIDDFRNALPEDDIRTIDLPGTGAHFRETSPWSVDGILESVRAEYRALNLEKRPLALLAHSLGGMVGLAWVQKYPQEVERAVVVNPSVSGLSPLSRRLQREGLKVGMKLARARTSLEREAAILEWIVNGKVQRETHVAEWARIRDERPVSGLNVFRQLVAGARFRLDDKKPECPLLILCGGGDRLAHPSCSRALQKHLNCDLETHPDAGHDLSIDAPQWMTKTIVDWLSRPAPRARLDQIGRAMS